MKTIKFLALMCALSLNLGVVLFAQTDLNLTRNLVRDGGMEVWREMGPDTDDVRRKDWQKAEFERLKKLKVTFADNGNILLPSAYEQGPFSVALREEKDVCSGKYSLRLQAESFYMSQGFDGAYAARKGDSFIVRFMAKGEGKAAVYLTVYGEGGSAKNIETNGAPVPDKWTQIEQRIEVDGAAPNRIYPRLSVTGDVLIDDVFVGRVLREDEAAPSP